MKKSRTLPSRFYQASLPPVVLYCGTVPLCFAVQITVSPHSTHTIKEKEKERTKIWKPRPSISFFFFLVPISIVGRVIFCWPYVWPFISTENFFFDLVKKINFFIFLFCRWAGSGAGVSSAPCITATVKCAAKTIFTCSYSRPLYFKGETLSFSFSDWK